MAINVKQIKTNIITLFELDGNKDKMPTESIFTDFDRDLNDDIMPKEDEPDIQDEEFELDINFDIMPRA